MKQAIFNPNGNDLWVTIKMKGLYFMSYTYSLWGTKDDSQAVLTNPMAVNNNKILIDDLYKINNDYQQNEPISRHHSRAVNIDLDVIILKDDNGYDITVSIWQADKMQIQTIIQNLYNDDSVPPIRPLAIDNRSSKLGKNGDSKNETFWFELINTKVEKNLFR